MIKSTFCLIRPLRPCIFSLRSSSKSAVQEVKPEKSADIGEAKEEDKKLSDEERLAKYKPSNFRPVKAYSSLSIGFITRFGNIEYDEPNIPLRDRFKMVKISLKRVVEELKEDARFAAFGFFRIFPCWRSHETCIEYKVGDEKTMKLFTTGSEKMYNQGYSTCQLVPSGRGTALFRGYLDTTVPKDGITERAGWCGLRSPMRSRAFGRKDPFHHWAHFTHLVLKIRGDGRTYRVNLNVRRNVWDIFWGDVWTYPLHTHGGPYWQTVKIPFSKFFLTVSGRAQDKQRRVIPEGEVGAVGITLADRCDGPFELEVDWIGVYYDKTHFEHFAWEGYRLPVLTLH